MYTIFRLSVRTSIARQYKQRVVARNMENIQTHFVHRAIWYVVCMYIYKSLWRARCNDFQCQKCRKIICEIVSDIFAQCENGFNLHFSSSLANLPNISRYYAVRCGNEWDVSGTSRARARVSTVCF